VTSAGSVVCILWPLKGPLCVQWDVPTNYLLPILFCMNGIRCRDLLLYKPIRMNKMLHLCSQILKSVLYTK
jgi:hypothetical protein